MGRRTPLYETHRRLGGRLIDFAGWEMPVQYTGILQEHAAVRTRAALFDVSHMGEIEVVGVGAMAACQNVTCNDVARLEDGRAQYNLLMLPDGGVVDDVLVHRLSGERYLFCVNAANREQALDHLRRHIHHDAEVIDRSDDYGQLALQGPLATQILSGSGPTDLGRLPRFRFCETRVFDIPVLLAHTGYTGEDGWELYCSSAEAPALWEALFEKGHPLGLVPAGLGARDTLRLEAGLPLYGHELTTRTTPIEARLEWVVKTGKGDFLGREALRAQQENGAERRLIGLQLIAPGVPRAEYPIWAGGRKIGQVTSGTKSPTLGKGIALGYVEPDYTEVGTPVAVEIRGRRVAAEVVTLPFYKRAPGRGSSLGNRVTP